jgi:hypothetical protein
VIYTRAQFRDITRLAAWSAAAYDGRIRVPLGGERVEPGELDRVLSHEFVHAVVAMTGGRTVPAWLNEGLATALEPAADRHHPEAAAPRTAARHELTQLHHLHRGFTGLSRQDAEVAYESSARAVRRLLDQRGPAAIVALLQDLARGVAFADAFRQRLAIRYEEFAALDAPQF